MKCKQCGGDCSVKETRQMYDGAVVRRRHACSTCFARFYTYELYDDVWGSIKKWALRGHIGAVKKRWALGARNLEIAEKLRAGVKHAVVAIEHGLSESMVSTIARRMGIPAGWRRRLKEKAT